MMSPYVEVEGFWPCSFSCCRTQNAPSHCFRRTQAFNTCITPEQPHAIQKIKSCISDHYMFKMVIRKREICTVSQTIEDPDTATDLTRYNISQDIHMNFWPHGSFGTQTYQSYKEVVNTNYIVQEINHITGSHKCFSASNKIKLEVLTYRIVDSNIRFQPWIPFLKFPCFKLLRTGSHYINYIKKLLHISCLSKSDSNAVICYNVRICRLLLL